MEQMYAILKKYYIFFYLPVSFSISILKDFKLLGIQFNHENLNLLRVCGRKWHFYECYICSSVQQQHLQNKTLFNSCVRLLSGTLISDIDIGVEYLRSEHTNLTLSNTKRGTDLGTLVVPFDQTFHPLHICYGWDGNFVVEDCFALNCTLISLSDFPK